MYDKDTVKKTKTEFYTSFGKFMGKHHSSQGNKVKWVNYNTGIKHIYLRLEADKKSARICIDLQHKDDDIRELFYEQFKALKTVFHETMKTEWVWVEKHINETGFDQCRIYIEINEFNIFEKSTWKKAFKFYKNYLLKFDSFWVEFKDLFLQMQ
jgi:hypothetical protein